MSSSVTMEEQLTAVREWRDVYSRALVNEAGLLEVRRAHRRLTRFCRPGMPLQRKDANALMRAAERALGSVLPESIEDGQRQLVGLLREIADRFKRQRAVAQ